MTKGKFMKSIILVFLLSVGVTVSQAQTQKAATTPAADALQTVEAGCGQCMFKMKGDDCDLAVRIDGKAYFVDGTKIDDHGDAHADNGFCNRVRKATVAGKIVNDRFVATSFKLLPEDKKTGKN